MGRSRLNDFLLFCPQVRHLMQPLIQCFIYIHRRYARILSNIIKNICDYLNRNTFIIRETHSTHIIMGIFAPLLTTKHNGICIVICFSNIVPSTVGCDRNPVITIFYGSTLKSIAFIMCSGESHPYLSLIGRRKMYLPALNLVYSILVTCTIQRINNLPADLISKLLFSGSGRIRKRRIKVNDMLRQQ